jgi:hypothetical protein
MRAAMRTRVSSRRREATCERAKLLVRPLAKMAIRTAVRTTRREMTTWTPDEC